MTTGHKISAAIFALALLFMTGPAQAAHHKTHWVESWATPEQIPEPRNALAPADLTDATLRQIVHLSIGGPEFRVHLSNAFGTKPLELDSVHVALAVSPASSAIDVSTDHALTFDGNPDVTIPAGSQYISDPVGMPLEPEANLAITIYLKNPPARETSHPGSRATSYLVHGNHVTDAKINDPKTFDHWFIIGGVDVTAPANAAAIVTLGDSITDGHASTTNGNNRWPDDLARRLLKAKLGRELSVVNEGIGGNRMLLDGLGPNALARVDRDVLAPAGVRYVIVLEGINDIGTFGFREHFRPLPGTPEAAHAALDARIIGAYKQIIARAHAHGLLVYGGTMTPFDGSFYTRSGPLTVKDRDVINQWIRAPGHFDAVIDFDKVVRDPKNPEHMLPSLDSGDHLHPSPAGYRAMADAIPLSLFKH